MSNSLVIDIISDLNLKTADDLNWENKPTSLFCVISGGLSKDQSVVIQCLKRLGNIYKGVFYIDGGLESSNINNYNKFVEEVKNFCQTQHNIVYLHNHVVILNGIAILACNGMYKNYEISKYTLDERSLIYQYSINDIGYLSSTLTTLQLHPDTSKILIISGSIPFDDLLYQAQDDDLNIKIEPGLALFKDTEFKVTTWIFGGSKLIIDTKINGRRYVNNPCISSKFYWPKRIEI
jgi:hypothetical protein